MSKDKIFIYGSGRSGLIGQLFSVRLVQMGFKVYFIGDMTTPIIGKDDLTILISNTGYTMSVVRTADIARRLGSHVVAVTSSTSGKLNHISNSSIIISVDKTPMDSDIAPLGTLFEDSALIFLDSLVPTLMKKLSADENRLRKNHAIWV
jgi:6-phospho-3-hexuloisomerase